MNSLEAKAVYDQLFIAFPQTREWLAKQKSAKDTFGVWCSVLDTVDVNDASTVVTQLIAGSSDMPEAYKRDTLPQQLKREANEIRGRREDKRKQFEMLHSHAKGTWNTVAQDGTGHLAITLGGLVKAGKITRNENDVMLRELIEWDHGGAAPEWMAEMSKQIPRGVLK